MYRKACLSNLYKTAFKKQLGEYFSGEQRRLSGLAFDEAAAFIEETFITSMGEILTFKIW